MQPIILDRSTLGYFADCPMQGYLKVLLEACIARIAGREVFDWEEKLARECDVVLLAKIMKMAKDSTANTDMDGGTITHDLIEKAFKECEGDLERVSDWFVENLPNVRPDIQPQVIQNARHVADMLADLHVAVLGVERQVDFCVMPQVGDRPPVVVTMCFDIIGSGLNMSLHSIDWKTGRKRRTNTETFDSFQAQTGSWLLWQQPEYAEIMAVHFWYYETRFGTKAYAKFVRNEEHPRLPHLTTEIAIKERIMSAVRLFLAGDRSCWPEEQKCCWCDVISLCPHANVNARKIDDDPAAFVDNMIVLKEHLSKMKRASTAYIKAHGAIEGEKYVFGKKAPSSKFTTEFSDKRKAKLGKTGSSDLDSHFG